MGLWRRGGLNGVLGGIEVKKFEWQGFIQDFSTGGRGVQLVSPARSFT